MKLLIIFQIACLNLLFTSSLLFAQDGPNPLYANHTFLLISPDARASGMGFTGGATSPSTYAIFWNPGKIAFNEDKLGIATSYISTSNEISKNEYSANITSYYKFNQQQALSASYRFYNVGTTTIPTVIINGERRESALSLAYSHKISKHLGIGVTGHLINHRTEGTFLGIGQFEGSGNNFAMDLGIFYTSSIKLAGQPTTWNLGATIANLGPKSSYSQTATNFIATNLRLSHALSTQLSKNHRLTWAVDISKWMVPTPDFGRRGSILPSGPWLEGILSSFGDAPGKHREEFQEIIWSTGFEYQFKKLLSLRTGYHFEHKYKGHRSNLTLGTGVRLGKFNLDASYLFLLNKPLPNDVNLIAPEAEQPANKFRVTLGLLF